MEIYTTPQRGRYGLRTSIQKLKDEVSIADYLSVLGHEVRNNRAECIIHGGDNPTSFQVYPEERRFRCHACHERGDIIDLVKKVEDHEDTHTAVLSLARRFNVWLPERPERWYRWQDKKQQIRDVAEEARKLARRRRLFKLLVLTSPEFEIDAPEERREAIRVSWRTFEDGMRRIGL